MNFNTSSLGSAKTFPGGRKDFRDFQELRHLVIEEQRIMDSLDEPVEVADAEEAPFGGPNGTYYAVPDALPDIAPPEYIPDIELSVLND
jgi:hypothetical protein